MSLLHKALASFGIGAAKVDTKIEQSVFTVGQIVQGEVHIHGGNVNQHIDAIFLNVYTSYIHESNDLKHIEHASITQVKVTEPFTIQASEERVIPFSFTLPIDCPVTMGKTNVWIKTSLAISNAINPKDEDYIEVQPTPLVADILDEITNLGFRLREVECEKASYKLRNHYPFVQEFEFVPTGGSFRGKLDELEIIFTAQAIDSVELLMQVDRKARGLSGLLSEALEMDESYVRFTINQHDIPNLRGTLQKLISKFA
ncbi:sporulation protein [Rummeliibacillus sp. NPDC094406]|uniref:sporulation protein n=1 Tax=Rummeliibacillus sp. NPDC094406 TaxID=3364511 RepID=UPI00382BBC30